MKRLKELLEKGVHLKERPKVDYRLDKEGMSEGEKFVLKEVKRFIGEVSQEFQREFWSFLKAYDKKRTRISKEIQRFLKEKQFDKPRFIVADSRHFREVLEECGLDDYELPEGCLLVVFNLPKPLAWYWWKGEGAWGSTMVDFKGTVIEWGTFYRELLPVIWQIRDSYESEGKLILRRINPEIVHDPLNFYYIWEAWV